LFLAASSRMLHLIKLTAVQGILLGILPLMSDLGTLQLENCVLGFINISVKGFILPYLLYVAMKKASVQRELEPVIGYSVSAFAVLLFCGISFWVADRLGLSTRLATAEVATSFALLLTGLFLIAARKKALTQVIGFLTFENGIALFGIGLMKHHPLLVELGILLDVFVLVFIMGIAVCQIKREFAHIDADKLSSLDDFPEKVSSVNTVAKEATK
ncbi:MAG: hydrogenase, partial [Lentisphaeria bacterium]|nr:hydrogenase [Lentisphaeria bacterium]